MLGEDELEAVRDAVADAPAAERIFRVNLVDAAGVVHAEVEKTVHVRRKNPLP